MIVAPDPNLNDILSVISIHFYMLNGRLCVEPSGLLVDGPIGRWLLVHGPPKLWGQADGLLRALPRSSRQFSNSQGLLILRVFSEKKVPLRLPLRP